MSVAFISDLHLAPEHPAIAENLLHFLATAERFEAIYILGDLFEYWLGDDVIPEHVQPLINAIQSLTQNAVPIYFIRGNRDFLVSDGFMELTGCQLLPDKQVIEHFDQRILIMHGDTLCTDDVDYQAFRKQVRDPQRQAQFLAQPLEARLQQLASIKRDAKYASAQKSDEIMDVNQQTVMQEMTDFACHYLIHGHTHRPAIHAQPQGWRLVLGDWCPHPSWAEMDASGIVLHDPRVNREAASATF
jgi:UDP-2,3-diacylglucosamine hydrolase